MRLMHTYDMKRKLNNFTVRNQKCKTILNCYLEIGIEKRNEWVRSHNENEWETNKKKLTKKRQNKRTNEQTEYV